MKVIGAPKRDTGVQGGEEEPCGDDTSETRDVAQWSEEHPGEDIEVTPSTQQLGPTTSPNEFEKGEAGPQRSALWPASISWSSESMPWSRGAEGSTGAPPGGDEDTGAKVGAATKPTGTKSCKALLMAAS